MHGIYVVNLLLYSKKCTTLLSSSPLLSRELSLALPLSLPLLSLSLPHFHSLVRSRIAHKGITFHWRRRNRALFLPLLPPLTTRSYSDLVPPPSPSHSPPSPLHFNLMHLSSVPPLFCFSLSFPPSQSRLPSLWVNSLLLLSPPQTFALGHVGHCSLSFVLVMSVVDLIVLLHFFLIWRNNFFGSWKSLLSLFSLQILYWH